MEGTVSMIGGATLDPSLRSQFCRAFEKEHGSTACEAIVEAVLGRRYNLADPAEALEYASSGAPKPAECRGECSADCS